jgi:hypothetical protein
MSILQSGECVNNITVGRGAGAISSNTAVGTNALLSNTTGIQNSAFGAAALRFNTTGNNNTASGTAALRDNTTANDNTATGHDALRFNTTGSYNTASGTAALRDNTTGNNNTAFGRRALFCNTTGSCNTASGTAALRFNTTGIQNTASGTNALRYNTTGDFNTAYGHNALRYNTTGQGINAFGTNALLSNTTGSFDTAFGNNALRYNTTGCQNSAFGNSSLRYNTTGDFNTAYGHNALCSNTTSNYNTAIGSAAMRNTTGSCNTTIGHESGRLITTGNRNTIIGSYTGNSAELDIRTSSNNVILSDGAGTISLLGVGNAIEIKAPSTQNPATQIPVFNSSPAGTLSRIRTRTPTQLRNDIDAFPNTGGEISGALISRLDTNNDAMRIVGRAGGTGNFRVSLIPTTLTANRNATFPDAGGTVAFTGSSDYRMKENIILSENAISRLNTLKVYRFNFKEEHILEEGLPTGLVDGFIAHELQEQMPEVVLGTKDQVDENGTPVYQSIDHAKMVPLLTAALQEALSEIELLKTRLTNAGL